MKALRSIIFIPLIFLIIEAVYTLLPLSLFGLMSLSKFWLIFLLIFYGGLAVVAFLLLPGVITWLSAKIAPSKTFAFYSILSISVLLAIFHIYGYWKTPDIDETRFGTFIVILLTFLTIGFAASFSFGAGMALFEEKAIALGIIFSIGAIIFYIGIFLTFCLLSTKICQIHPDKTYFWYSGIWHGIFVIPHWVMSWFADDIYCKAPLRTAAYHIWWWISFIFIGLSIFGRGNRQRNREY